MSQLTTKPFSKKYSKPMLWVMVIMMAVVATNYLQDFILGWNNVV